MTLIERSIRQPVTVTVCVLLLVIFGGLAVLRVPIQLTPNVDQPIISVTTRWFGASPQEIEQEIIEEQEEVLKTVSGLREMASKSVEGEGSIELRFFVGVDKEAALNEVRDKLRQVPQYPLDVDEPVVESVNSASDDAIAWLVIRPKDGNLENIKKALADPKRAAGFDGDVTALQDFLEDEAQPILERVNGVARVQIFGGREREMQVRIDPEKLAARGISITDFNNALRRENQNVTAGTFYEGKRDTSVRAVGQYEDPEEILNTVVAYTEQGAPVYVRDVATAELSVKKQTGFVRALGENVVALRVQREIGSNALAVMKELRVAIDRVNTEILQPKNWGIELHQVYDETIYIDQSIKQAGWDLFIGALLAAGVLFITLRSFGATMVVCLSIPISIVGTFLGMALTGRNLNVISMAGLSFAIGMGIDNTIVVLENIFRHREMGKDRFRAAIDGAGEVWGAIVAATLANIAVFLPVVLIEEEAGQLFRDISVAISLSLFFYMIVSPTVIPMLATLFLRKVPGGLAEGEGAREQAPQTILGRLTRPIGRWGERMSSRFYRVVLWLTGGFLRRVVLALVMVGISLAGAYYLMPPQNYLPQGNQNFVFGLMFPPPGYNLDEFHRIADVIEGRLRPWWEVVPREGDSPELIAQKEAKLKELQAQWTKQTKEVALPALEKELAEKGKQLEELKGQLAKMKKELPPDQFEEKSAELKSAIGAIEGEMPMKFGMMMGMKYGQPPAGIEQYFFVSFNGAVFMGATSADPSNVMSVMGLMNGAMNGIPGTPGFALQVPIFDLGRTTGNTIELAISGTDYDKVRPAASLIQMSMMQQFGSFVQSDPSYFNLGRAETRITPDRLRAAAAGIPTSTIREMAKVAVDGEIIGDYRYRGQAIDLTVMTTDGPGATSATKLPNTPLASPQGTPVPITAVANFIDTSAPQQINRLERQPAVLLSLQLPMGMTVEEAERILNTRVLEPLRAGGQIPPELTIKPQGSADKLSQFKRAFLPGFILAAVITYLLLAALFESWLHPLTIILSVPFALVGGFLALFPLAMFTGAQMDVLVMLGFVILIGTIVNNPILIVHQALNYMREGLDRQHAIAKSTQTRVRPIFMSVITSVAGMAPLVVLGGAGSELYRGLGAVVIGGLLVSTVFTLFLTPTLMSLLMDVQDLFRRLFNRTPRPPKSPRRMDEPVPVKPVALEEEPVTARTRIEPA
jgi:hydrophobic/amphiphilic exporter-1 (mainly G- bacteria), HAE1 family